MPDVRPIVTFSPANKRKTMNKRTKTLVAVAVTSLVTIAATINDIW